MTYLKEISVKCLIFNIGYSEQTTQILKYVYFVESEKGHPANVKQLVWLN